MFVQLHIMNSVLPHTAALLLSNIHQYLPLYVVNIILHGDNEKKKS